MTPGAPPEFWLYLPQMRMPFGTITERARAAEQAGFDGIALMDHFAPPGLPSADSFDAMTTASAVAASTTRLKISHLVLCSSFRHPSVLAKEVVSLDHLTMPLVAAYADWWNCPGYAVDRFDELRPLAGRARISTQHPVGLAADPADVPAVDALTQRRFGGWAGVITGTATDVAAALADLQARGVERFYLQFSDFGTPDTLARFGADVIPRLRAVLAPKR